MRRRLATLTVLFLIPGAVAAAVPGPLDDLLEHVHWKHEDTTWYTALGMVDANDDGVRDPVVAGGDRDSPYVHCLVPPGFPGPRVNFVKDTVMEPASKLAVLDGRDGEPIWQVEWRSGGLITEQPERERYELLQGMHVGDLDGSGQEDLLVLRQSVAADQSDQSQLLTMHDPRTGAVRWELKEEIPGDAIASQRFLPFELFGEPGGLWSRSTITVEFSPVLKVTFEVDNRLIHLPEGAPPVTFAELEEENFAIPIPHGEGYRLVFFPIRIEGPPPVAYVDAKAIDLTLDEDEQPVLEEAWFRQNAGGDPARVIGGDDPAVVVGRIVDADNNAIIAAIDLSDGEDRWTAPINAGPSGGTFITVDANGDGIDDVVASPAFGPEETGLFAGGFFPQITVLDGRNGQELWSREDRLGKFRAWVLDTADVTGSGTPEIVAALTGQDGFPTCSQPADDTGIVAAYDLATGAVRCRFHTDRVPLALGAADLDGEPGEEIVAPTLGGNVYSFTHADPGCDLLTADP